VDGPSSNQGNGTQGSGADDGHGPGGEHQQGGSSLGGAAHDSAASGGDHRGLHPTGGTEPVGGSRGFAGSGGGTVIANGMGTNHQASNGDGASGTGGVNNSSSGSNGSHGTDVVDVGATHASDGSGAPGGGSTGTTATRGGGSTLDDGTHGDSAEGIGHAGQGDGVPSDEQGVTSTHHDGGDDKGAGSAATGGDVQPPGPSLPTPSDIVLGNNPAGGGVPSYTSNGGGDNHLRDDPARGDIPEPASLLLFGAGLTMLGTRLRRREPR
jgi:hypothetical protein